MAKKCLDIQIKGRALNIGAGDVCFEGVINVDIEKTPDIDVVADWLNLPFRDGSFTFVNASAILEHLTPVQRGRALRETYRVLCPGGTTQMGVPHLPSAFQFYAQGQKEKALGIIYGEPWRKGWGHVWGYDRTDLEQLFLDAGFMVKGITIDSETRPTPCLVILGARPI